MDFITIRIDEQQKRILKDIARKQELTVSQILRTLARTYIKKAVNGDENGTSQ